MVETILKVGITETKEGNKIKVTYESRGSNGTMDDLTIASYDPPRPELVASLNALVPFLLSCLQLPPDYTENCPVAVVAVSWTFKEESTGVILGATADVGEAGPWKINTPLMSYEAFGPEFQEAIDRVAAEGQLYVEGNRAQVRFA